MDDAQLRGTLAGLHIPESLILLLGLHVADGTPLLQPGDPLTLLLVVGPLGGGGLGCGFGLLDHRLVGRQPFLSDLDSILTQGGWVSLVLAIPGGPRSDGGRLLAGRLARGEWPGDDPGGAEGQEDESPGRVPPAR